MASPLRRLVVGGAIALILATACSTEATGSAEDLARSITTDTTDTEPVACADNPDCADAAENPPTTTTTTTQYDDPQPEDFTIDIIVLSENCFGSAGCNVTYDIEVGWLVYLDPSVTYQLTYEVTGSDYGTSTETIDITDEEYTPPLIESFTSTPGPGTALTATPIRIR